MRQRIPLLALSLAIAACGSPAPSRVPASNAPSPAPSATATPSAAPTASSAQAEPDPLAALLADDPAAPHYLIDPAIRISAVIGDDSSALVPLRLPAPPLLASGARAVRVSFMPLLCPRDLRGSIEYRIVNAQGAPIAFERDAWLAALEATYANRTAAFTSFGQVGCTLDGRAYTSDAPRPAGPWDLAYRPIGALEGAALRFETRNALDAGKVVLFAPVWTDIDLELPGVTGGDLVRYGGAKGKEIMSPREPIKLVRQVGAEPGAAPMRLPDGGVVGRLLVVLDSCGGGEEIAEMQRYTVAYGDGEALELGGCWLGTISSIRESFAVERGRLETITIYSTGGSNRNAPGFSVYYTR